MNRSINCTHPVQVAVVFEFNVGTSNFHPKLSGSSHIKEDSDSVPSSTNPSLFIVITVVIQENKEIDL